MNIKPSFYEDYVIGETRSSGGRTITESDIIIHAGQTGDFYPHHVDAVWCATQPWGTRIAHGTLVLSIAVGLLSTEVNYNAVSYGYDRIRFVRPVHIGDTITSRSEIVGARDHVKKPNMWGIIEEMVTVTNQSSEVVLSLIHLYLVDKRHVVP